MLNSTVQDNPEHEDFEETEIHFVRQRLEDREDADLKYFALNAGERDIM